MTKLFQTKKILQNFDYYYYFFFLENIADLEILKITRAL